MSNEETSTQEYHEVEEVSTNPVTEVIAQALMKHNVTDAIINKLKQQYGSLTIAGQEDREGYRAVKEARLDCKNLRVLAKKITTAGREQALQIQKAWVAKEKEVIARISEVEDYLQAQEDTYNEEKERIKREEKEKQEQRAMKRTSELSKLGATFDGVNFVLGEAIVEGAIVREVEDEMYNADILPQFQAVFAANELRLEKERKEKEIEQQRIEAEIKELEERREKERLEREEKERQEKEAAEKIYNERVDQLSEMQFVFVKRENRFKCYHVLIDDANVKNADEQAWKQVIELATEEIAKGREEAERQRTEEENAKVEKQRLMALGSIRMNALAAFGVDVAAADAAEWTEEVYIAHYDATRAAYEQKKFEKWEKEQQEKKEREEKERQEQEATKTDTTKYREYIAHVLSKPFPEFRSGQYRKKGAHLLSIINEIKAL